MDFKSLLTITDLENSTGLVCEIVACGNTPRPKGAVRNAHAEGTLPLHRGTHAWRWRAVVKANTTQMRGAGSVMLAVGENQGPWLREAQISEAGRKATLHFQCPISLDERIFIQGCGIIVSLS